MSLYISPESVKKDMVKKTTRTNIEAIAYDESTDFFEITLTYIGTDLSVTGSGYNELEVMSDLITKLNNLVIAYNFNIKIPESQIDYKEVELVNVVSDNSKASKK